jgi:squalene-hopene/tetraprenyl-beta-curcumene cyclase
VGELLPPFDEETAVKVLLLSAVAACLAAPALRAAEPEWDKKKAAARLDERAKWWVTEGGKKLATDAAGDVTCLSCHTTATYALARPALGRALDPKATTPVLDGLLKDIDRRLAAWPTVTHMYEFTADKKKESRGTEAVLNALALAWNDAARGEAATTAATKRAFERLWEAQREDGGWDWLRFTLEPWETGGAEYYGAALAALAVGTAPGYYVANPDPALEKRVESLRKYLKGKRDKENYYTETWLLLASTKLSGLLSADEQKSVVAGLTKLRKMEGEDAGGWVLLEFTKWRYNAPQPPEKAPDLDPRAKKPDGYATGLVVFTLLRAGVPADDPAVAAGLKWLKKNQQPDGSWPAVSINKKRAAGSFAEFFMSDAATAWASLALLEADSGKK